MSGPVFIAPYMTTILQQHNHWLQMAINFPHTEAFYAVVYHALQHVNRTQFSYKGGPLPPGQRPESIAQIAADPNNNQAINAAAKITELGDQLQAVCTLASYLTGEGDPRHSAQLRDYPHKVLLTPSWDVEENDTVMRPVRSHPEDMTALNAHEREMLLSPVQFQFVIATLNRFHLDTEVRNAAVTARLFLVLVTGVTEIRDHVASELVAEGYSAADQETLFAYISDEMRAFAQSPIDFKNAHEYWNSTWTAISDTIRSRDFHRMQQAIQARERSRADVAAKVREKTARKRQTRTAAKSRRRNESQQSSTAATTTLPPQPQPDNDDDEEDDLEGILYLP